MEVYNCRDCGKLFNYIGGLKICPTCAKKLDEKFVEVKEYIRENPLVTVYQVSEEMEVSVNQIKQWIRDERLAFTNESNAVVYCDACGKPIKTGRYCDSCKNELIHSLKSTYVGKEAAPSNKRNDSIANARIRFQGDKNM